MKGLVERQPDDVARTVAAVAVRRLGESVSQLPFLRFVAPLRGRMRDDVVGLAVGADGLLIEVHPHPDKALKDGAQSLTCENFSELVADLKPIAEAVGRRI